MAVKRTPPYHKFWHPEAKKLWRFGFKHYDLEKDEVELLRTACHCLTNYYKAQAQLETESLTVPAPGNSTKKNPLIEICRIERNGYFMALKALGLEGEQPKANVGRPAKPPL